MELIKFPSLYRFTLWNKGIEQKVGDMLLDGWIRREESPAVGYPVSFLSKWVVSYEKDRFSVQFDCDATGKILTSSIVLTQAYRHTGFR